MNMNLFFKLLSNRQTNENEQQLLYWGHDGKNWIIFLWEVHLYVEGHMETVDFNGLND